MQHHPSQPGRSRRQSSSQRTKLPASRWGRRRRTRPNAEVVLGNALDEMRKLDDASIHLIATDPPYFIGNLGQDWTKAKVKRRVGQMASYPSSMKFDRKQSAKFEAFMRPIAEEAVRILKPGGFFVAFSQARLYHRLAVATEDAGFEVRDMLAWRYDGQAKAFSMDHLIRKMKVSEQEKARILASTNGRKTPQLKPQMEPMVLAQKPRVGTFIENWMEHETGLVDTTASLDGKFPGNVMYVPKPTKAEKGDGNDHLTVKPVRLMEQLIQLFSARGQIVLDPFTGSGTTGVAALNMGRDFLGFEIDPDYASIARRRIAAAGVA